MEKLVDGKRRKGHVEEAGHLVAHGVGVEFAAHGILHPGVGHQNPPGRNRGTKTGEPRRGQMETRRHLLPAEIHHSDEGALHEKRHNALNGERRTENVAHEPGIVAPIRAEFKFKDDTRGHTHGEIHAEETLPENGGVLPEWLTCAIIARFHDAHDEGKTQREGHKEPMIDGGQCELGTRPVNERRVNSQEMCHCF